MTSRNARSSTRPKLVSKKRTSGRRSRRSSRRSIRTGPCYRKARLAPCRDSGAAGVFGLLYSLRPWTSGTSPSKARWASASRRWPTGSARDSMRRSCSTRPTIPFSPTSTPGGPAPASRRSCSYTLARHRQQTSLRQRDLFSQLTICDYLFERDKIYAYLNLDDNELFIYQRLYELLAPDLPGARSGDLSAGPDRRAAPPPARTAAHRRRPADPRGPLRPRAERGLQPFLLPLHRLAAARRRDLAVRSDVGRGRGRRHRAPDTGDGQGHEILRAET